MAHRTWPDTRLPGSTILQPGEHIKLPAVGRLDWDALDEGRVSIRYTAVDPVWSDVDGLDGLIRLNDHVRRLWTVTHEMGSWAKGAGWEAVAANLHLAGSLTDVFADTDLDGSSMWCGPVADYEDANSEVAVKHLAGMIVFNLVWMAYECAVEALEPSGGKYSPKGACGRNLLSSIAQDREFPFLRATLTQAWDNLPGSTNFAHPDMKRMVAAGHWVGIAGEHLRQFRNRVTHGDVPKPEPQDWGSPSEYFADLDPAIRQFHFNIRLTLLSIQTLATGVLDDDDKLQAWLRHLEPALLVVNQLHCEQGRFTAQGSLPLNAPLLPNEDMFVLASAIGLGD